MTSKPKLYMIRESPAVRAVLITIKYLGIDVEHHELNWREGDFSKPEFLKLNPQHTVPTFVDEDGAIWDSHAINIYLVTKYAKDTILYPENYHQRAVVNQRMYFEGGPLYGLLRFIDMGYMKKIFKEIPLHIIDEVKEHYVFLEKFLDGYDWAAGSCLTLADFSLMPTVTSLEVHIPIDPHLFPNITAWLKRVQDLPCCADDSGDLALFKEFINFVKP